jgi:hypothetical protein
MDGLGAAWAIWRKFGDSVEYIPVSYGKPIAGDFTSKHVLMVDFSLKRDELFEMIGLGVSSIVVLDHHKTAQAELETFAIHRTDCASLSHADIDRILFDLAVLDLAPIVVRFDMEKSGARLAWEFAHDTITAPLLIGHIEDRDLWRFKIPGTKEIHTAIRSYPPSLLTFDSLVSRVSSLFVEGESILRAERQIMEGALKHAYKMCIDGHVVPVVNCILHFASDAAHELLNRNPEAPFSAVWCIGDNGRMHFSLRSEDARADVSEIAKRFGGGGHRNAAGFEISANDASWKEAWSGTPPSFVKAAAAV